MGKDGYHRDGTLRLIIPKFGGITAREIIRFVIDSKRIRDVEDVADAEVIGLI